MKNINDTISANVWHFNGQNHFPLTKNMGQRLDYLIWPHYIKHLRQIVIVLMFLANVINV